MPRGRSIVFVNQATGYLTIDIVNEFAGCGHFERVALIAGSIRVQDVNLDSSVRRSKICLYDRGNPRRKLFSWLRGTLQVFYLLLTRYRKYEVFYITIPPFAYLLSLVLPNRFSVLVFDVYPDVLAIYNIKPNSLLYRAWASWNRRLFVKAHRIFTIGEGMATLVRQYAEPQAISTIHNWPGLTKVEEVSRDENVFIREQGLAGKFIVQYSGNIGYTHNIEALVEIARAMQQHSDIFFLIIGRGEKLKTVTSLVDAYGLNNCRVLPFQPDELLNHTLSAADVGVVLLDEKTAHVSIPSKIYNLQVVGVPILGIVDTASELARHVAKHRNGACFNASDRQAIIDYILKLRDDNEFLRQLRVNSRDAAGQYTPSNAAQYVNKYISNDGCDVTKAESTRYTMS